MVILHSVVLEKHFFFFKEEQAGKPIPAKHSFCVCPFTHSSFSNSAETDLSAGNEEGWGKVLCVGHLNALGC